jgi:hypothetical protein
MRQKIYTFVAVLWCAVFPAGKHLIGVIVESPEGTLGQAVAVALTMLGLGVAAVLLDPKKTKDPLILHPCETENTIRNYG